MIHRPLDQITEADLQNLVRNGVAEGRQLEYKLTLPGKNDEEIKEFLKDVSAMANSSGGDIIYGIHEGPDTDGNTVATAVEGVSGEDADQVKLRLDQVLRDCIKPRLIGVAIQPVKLASSATVFVVRVPRSWNAPHVVDRKKHWRFYFRHSAQAYPMDVTELRHSFALSDTLQQRLIEFRLDRLAKIAEDDGPQIVLHIQPFSSVQPDARIDVRTAARHADNMPLVYAGLRLLRINFNGLLAYEAEGQGYVQLFRNGTLEAVDTGIAGSSVLDPKGPNERPFSPLDLERNLIQASSQYFTLLRQLEIGPPLMVSLSLLGVEGYTLAIPEQQTYRDKELNLGFIHLADLSERARRSPIDRDELLIPAELVEDVGTDADRILKTVVRCDMERGWIS